MSNEEIVCARHGRTPIRFACRHVAIGVACGWHAEEDLGRCDACVRLDGDRLAEELTIVCTACWDEARARNEPVPPLARGQALRLTEDERTALQAAASAELRVRQDAATARWQIAFGEPQPFSFDATAATLTIRGVIADARIVGVYSTKTDVFQWGWTAMGEDNPLSIPSCRLPPFGEIRGLDELVHLSWRGKLDRCWEMTALAGYLLGYEAAFCMPQEHQLSFVLLDRIHA